MGFYAKKDEIVRDGRWIKVGFWKYVWFKLSGIVACVSAGYPSVKKDKGYAHPTNRPPID
jgi:hypothetical protein